MQMVHKTQPKLTNWNSDNVGYFYKIMGKGSQKNARAEKKVYIFMLLRMRKKRTIYGEMWEEYWNRN